VPLRLVRDDEPAVATATSTILTRSIGPVSLDVTASAPPDVCWPDGRVRPRRSFLDPRPLLLLARDALLLVPVSDEPASDVDVLALALARRNSSFCNSRASSSSLFGPVDRVETDTPSLTAAAEAFDVDEDAAADDDTVLVLSSATLPRAEEVVGALFLGLRAGEPGDEDEEVEVLLLLLLLLLLVALAFARRSSSCCMARASCSSLVPVAVEVAEAPSLAPETIVGGDLLPLDLLIALGARLLRRALGLGLGDSTLRVSFATPASLGGDLPSLDLLIALGARLLRLALLALGLGDSTLSVSFAAPSVTVVVVVVAGEEFMTLSTKAK
jgi:hypothetical protein